MFAIHRSCLLVMVALGLAATLGPVRRVEAAAGAAPKPGAGSGRTPSGFPNRPMPDTVLAQVANGRVVTLSGFRSAWRQVEPPARPDSLTPEGARKFLDLLIGKEALGEAALKEKWVWTDKESSDYRGLSDRLTMKVVLDSTLGELRARLQARGDTTRNPGALGVAARESLAVRTGLRFERDVLERLTKTFSEIPKPAADSPLVAQLRVLGTPPRIDPADYPKVVARSSDGPYTAGELLQGWIVLNPVYRPRIERREQLEDVIRNQLFERRLRRDAERRRIAAWPAIAAELARKREFFAVSHLVGRDVYGKIALDSVTLHRYFEGNRKEWDLPLRAIVAHFVLSSRPSAQEMATRLAQPAEAESLLANARRAGARFGEVVAEETDSVLFRRAVAARPGAVIGPEEKRDGWHVWLVRAIEPPRSRSYAEAAVLVRQKWYSLEGERLMVDLLERCRRSVRVATNERALARLTAPGESAPSATR